MPHNQFLQIAAYLELLVLLLTLHCRSYGVMVQVFPDCPSVLLHSKELDYKQVCKLENEKYYIVDCRRWLRNSPESVARV